MPEDFSKEARKLFDTIEKADPIIVFRHVNPDADATGSQLGLVEWLKFEYPHKTILAAGQGESMDDIADDQFENALAIITDTSNADRIDDQRFKDTPAKARIDHHVKVEDFGEMDIVDDKAAAACEIEALLFRDAGKTIPVKAAQHLMDGLIADSQRFTIPTVRQETFDAASWLVSQVADPNLSAKTLFNRSFADFQLSTRIRHKAALRKKFLFSLVSIQDYLSLGVPYEEAKNQVNCLSAISGIEIWALFTEQPDHLYSASLRSASISVREIAAEFGGGGHECACGIKNLTSDQLAVLIERLTEHSIPDPVRPENTDTQHA